MEVLVNVLIGFACWIGACASVAALIPPLDWVFDKFGLSAAIACIAAFAVPVMSCSLVGFIFLFFNLTGL